MPRLHAVGLAMIMTALLAGPAWAVDGNFVVQVPEPTTLAMLGVGAATWFGLRKVLRSR